MLQWIVYSFILISREKIIFLNPAHTWSLALFDKFFYKCSEWACDPVHLISLPLHWAWEAAT